MRYNLARAYMDGGFYAQGEEILEELYDAEPDQYRFGVHLAICYRTARKVPQLRALVERMTRDRQAAAAQAGEDLQGLCRTASKRARRRRDSSPPRARSTPRN